MKHCILMLAVVCAVVSFLSFGAPRVPYSDANWAFQVCEIAGDLSSASVVRSGRGRLSDDLADGNACGSVVA